MAKHKHAELIMQYAEDAMETEAPWDRWEYSYNGKVWFQCTDNPGWTLDVKYRRKISWAKD